MTINKQEMIKVIKELEEEYCTINGNGSYIVGVRFEDKEREINEEIDNSRHNLDREYEGEMPEFGTEEYEELFELDGASAHEIDWIVNEFESNTSFDAYHCYFIIGSNAVNMDDALDEGEVVVEDAKVVHVLY